MEKPKLPRSLDALIFDVPVRLASSFAIALAAWGLSIHYNIIFFPNTASSTDLVRVLVAGLGILSPEAALGALAAFVVAAFAAVELWGTAANTRGAFILMCISIVAFLFLWVGLDDYFSAQQGTRRGRVSLVLLALATRVVLGCFFLYLSYWLNQTFQNLPLG